MAQADNEKIETGEVTGTSEYVPLTEVELKQVATGVLHNQVFGTWSLDPRDAHLIPSIFMVIALMDDIERKKLKRDGIVHVYEWVDRAGPRAINGYPMFLSARLLNSNDSVRLQNKINQIKEALDAI